MNNLGPAGETHIQHMKLFKGDTKVEFSQGNTEDVTTDNSDENLENETLGQKMWKFFRKAGTDRVYELANELAKGFNFHCLYFDGNHKKEYYHGKSFDTFMGSIYQVLKILNEDKMEFGRYTHRSLGEFYDFIYGAALYNVLSPSYVDRINETLDEFTRKYSL